MLRGLSVGIRGRRQNLSPRSPVGVFISVLFVPVLLRADASNLSVESEQLTDAQQRRCSSLEAWWTDYTASAVPALIAAAESPHSRGVLAGPVLAAWRNDCGATPLSIDAVFAEATRMFTHDELVASATSSSDEIHSLVPAGDTQALALALLRHGLAQEAAAMRQRVSTLMDGTATRLNLTRTRADSLPSEIGENVGAQVDLVPAHQATRDGTFLRNMSCMRPVARTEQRRYNQDLLHQELENGRRCSKGDCHQRCALTVMDGLVSDAEAFRLIGHFLRVWKKTQRNYQEVKGKPMIDLARSVANSELSDHLFFVRLVERVRSTASAVFGVPLQRLRLASHFVSEIGARSDSESTVHVDEASFSRFHYSAVLWLNPLQDPAGATVPSQGANFSNAAASVNSCLEFDGGRLTFFQANAEPWLAAEPVAGRATFFSSGWENRHRVSPVHSGQRYALNLFLTAEPPPPTPAARFVHDCIRPRSLAAWEQCEREWSEWLVT